MRLGPRRTNSFEGYTHPHQTVHALEALAQTGAVELNVEPKINAGLEVSATLDALHGVDRLTGPYREYLPDHERRQHALDATPDQTARQAVAVLHRWIAGITPILERLRPVVAELDSLRLFR